ncbi:MAG: thioredoxin domain-containing protein [Candidatus Omnitrophica bacterium]|nr:thioredoxin domain-containing protein [Candidatus Omnitrophota bacterium]
MAKVSKKGLTIVLIVGGIAIFSGLKFMQKQQQVVVAQNPAAIKLPQRAQGNPQAKIKIIEFIDFQCPACAKGYQLLHEYLKNNPDKLYIELRYFPLAMHKHGESSARWGECAARQDKFWPFMDLLIARQNEWAAMIDPVPSFEAIGKQAGVNLDQLNACLKDDSVKQAIATDQEEGKMRMVSSTPSYFINHEMVVGTKSLQMKLDELLGIKTPVEVSIPSEVKP